VAAGGLLRFKEVFASSPFRERFERKGRFAGMLAKIPTCLILEIRRRSLASLIPLAG
jgi:glucokinase